MLAVAVCETERLVVFVTAEQLLQVVDVEPRGEGSVFERLRDDVSRGAAALKFDDDHTPGAVHAEQVDPLAAVGADLTPDEQ